jgi:hypothetical protein
MSIYIKSPKVVGDVMYTKDRKHRGAVLRDTYGDTYNAIVEDTKQMFSDITIFYHRVGGRREKIIDKLRGYLASVSDERLTGAIKDVAVTKKTDLSAAWHYDPHDNLVQVDLWYGRYLYDRITEPDRLDDSGVAAAIREIAADSCELDEYVALLDASGVPAKLVNEGMGYYVVCGSSKDDVRFAAEHLQLYVRYGAHCVEVETRNDNGDWVFIDGLGSIIADPCTIKLKEYMDEYDWGEEAS